LLNETFGGGEAIGGSGGLNRAFFPAIGDLKKPSRGIFCITFERELIV
jgi:hypothetical protein